MIYNFGAGPSVLPKEVLKKVQEELLDFEKSGMSVMEISHRSKAFQKVIDEAESDLRDLMSIPQNYKILFLQGGASSQFSMVPMNLAIGKKAYYNISGAFGAAPKKRVHSRTESRRHRKLPDSERRIRHIHL